MERATWWLSELVWELLCGSGKPVLLVDSIHVPVLETRWTRKPRGPAEGL